MSPTSSGTISTSSCVSLSTVVLPRHLVSREQSGAGQVTWAEVPHPRKHRQHCDFDRCLPAMPMHLRVPIDQIRVTVLVVLCPPTLPDLMSLSLEYTIIRTKFSLAVGRPGRIGTGVRLIRTSGNSARGHKRPFPTFLNMSSKSSRNRLKYSPFSSYTEVHITHVTMVAVQEWFSLSSMVSSRFRPHSLSGRFLKICYSAVGPYLNES